MENIIAQLRQMLWGLCYGVIVDATLTGVATVQAYHYYKKYPTDTTAVKLLVALSSVMIYTGGILNSLAIYHFAVTGWGNLASLPVPLKSYYASILMTALPCCLIQVFLAWRVRRLTGRWWVLMAASILALVQAVAVIASITSQILTQDNTKMDAQKPYAIAWFSAEIIANLINSYHLVYFFCAKRTGFRNTDDLLKRLAIVTVQSGSAVTAWSIAAICAYTVWGGGTAVLFVESSPPFYLITFLSFLNSRDRHSDRERIYWTEGVIGGRTLSPVHVSDARFGAHLVPRVCPGHGLESPQSIICVEQVTEIKEH